MNVPLMNPAGQYEHLTDRINDTLRDVVASGQFVLGPNVAAFEKEAAAYLGVKHAIGVANGTDALVIALRALGIGAGDEVVCPTYTFYASAESIAAVGATPVFVDVDPATWTIDVEATRAALNDRTKAIMPVHLYGQAADMDALRELASDAGIAIVEDTAQAWGATWNGQRVGGLGDVGTFSFYPTKNLACFGDGGLLVTNRDDIAEQARLLRFHGSTDKVTFSQVGYNSRLDEMQAALLRIFLEEIDGWNAQRRTIASWYAEDGLGDLVDLPVCGEGREHIYHLYMVRTEHREAVMQACREQGVGAAVYYGVPMHLQPVFAHLGYGQGDFPVAEGMGEHGLALPMFPTMTREQVGAVVSAVKAAAPALAKA